MPRPDHSTRNAAILRLWQRGQPAKQISVRFRLSPTRIRQIALAELECQRTERRMLPGVVVSHEELVERMARREWSTL